MSGIVGPQSAGTDVFQTLSLLSNKEELERRLEELRLAKSQLDESIALAGPAQEIVRLRQEIEDERVLSRAHLQNTEAEIFSIVDKAKKEAESIIEAAKAVASNIKVQATQKFDEAASVAAVAAEKNEKADKYAAELDKARSDLVGRETALQHAQAELIETQERINRRIKELEEAQEKFAAVLKG